MWRAFPVVFLSFLAFGCSDSGSSMTPCAPGNVLVCECPDGSYGTASCGPTGTVGACACGDVLIDIIDTPDTTQPDVVEDTATELDVAETTVPDVVEPDSTPMDTNIPDNGQDTVDVPVDAECVGKAQYDSCTADGENARCFDGQCLPLDCGDASCRFPYFYLNLPDTGEVDCRGEDTYDIVTCCHDGGTVLCGQDADTGLDAYWEGPRYALSTNGEQTVVTDNITGLQWMQCTFGRTGKNCEQGFALPTDDWTMARDECRDATWGGFDDWRLPTEQEYLSLTDLSQTTSVVLDPKFFPLQQATYGQFWKADGGKFAHRWANRVSVNSKVPFHRCVRGETILPAPAERFTDLSGGALDDTDEAFVDNLRGLIWYRGALRGGFNRVEANYYCGQLQAGGLSWRVPSYNDVLGLESSPVVGGTLLGKVDPRLFGLDALPWFDQPDVDLDLRTSSSINWFNNSARIPITYDLYNGKLGIDQMSGALTVTTCVASLCGNGVIDPGEACDGTLFANGETCETESYVGGTLSCNAGCQLDTSTCTACTPGATGQFCLGTSCLADGSCGTCTTAADCPIPYLCTNNWCQLN